jgi:hypothetical protein
MQGHKNARAGQSSVGLPVAMSIGKRVAVLARPAPQMTMTS